MNAPWCAASSSEQAPVRLAGARCRYNPQVDNAASAPTIPMPSPGRYIRKERPVE